MTPIDGDLTSQARRAVRAIAINRWSDVAPLLRLRAVATTDQSVPNLALGPGLWLELAVAVPHPQRGSDTEFIIRPGIRNLRAWDRPLESVWRVAAGNIRASTAPATTSHRHEDLVVRLATGSPWTSGALLDVGYFMRRWWPDAILSRRIASGGHGRGPSGRGRGSRNPHLWARALSPTTIAVVEQLPVNGPPRSDADARARTVLLALTWGDPDELPPVIVPWIQSQYVRKEAC